MRIYNNSSQSSQNAIALKVYRTSFTNNDLNSNTFVAIHNLNTPAVSVCIFDNAGEQINPGKIIITDSNTTTIDLGDYTPITGTYSLIIHG